MIIKKYFNAAKVKTMATVDENGQPNVCPCGTATMPDDQTIIIGCVGFFRSRENIIKTKKATFMAQKPVDQEYWTQYEKTGEKPYPAGYRFYCRFIEETNEKTIVEPIHEKLKNRVGGKLADKLASAMIFQVEEVKEIIF
ncbi:MAG: pyridoxamine 5'-phosphate oxidase family protein [Thermoleophilia bacterium]